MVDDAEPGPFRHRPRDPVVAVTSVTVTLASVTPFWVEQVDATSDLHGEACHLKRWREGGCICCGQHGNGPEVRRRA